MSNKVVNKQIPLQSIIDVANKLEDYKEKYDRIFEEEENKNKNLPYSEKKYEYENGKANMKYTIEFHNGKNITESDYNWFIGNLNQPNTIKRISLDLSITYMGKSQRSEYNDEFNKIYIFLDFRDAGMNLNYSDAIVEIETTNQENEAHNVYYEIMNILEDNEDRYNKTIKNRKIRTQSFTISVGIILSYIVYLIIKMNADKLTPFIAQYLDNKLVLLIAQWIFAIVGGNVLSYWYIVSIYKPLLPDTRYAGYDSSTYKSKYKDDVDEYVEHSEVHFGKFWDAAKRRNKIEKIYKVTSKIVIVQVIISIVLFFILK